MSVRHAFHGLKPTDTVSLTLTDAGLIAEPWENVEIDEAAHIESGTVVPVKPSWRSLLAGFKARRLLA